MNDAVIADLAIELRDQLAQLAHDLDAKASHLDADSCRIASRARALVYFIDEATGNSPANLDPSFTPTLAPAHQL